ncbi:E3 ubiquitin-protein ligase RNF14 [Mytilus galloprovincialis]|uniref:E3 ubiquitin-protein ligase RNF14 n=1 Tax=Mytilus galloprovincialis TaxID=29158 RepID=A0A8B6EYC4_MYTGA|nr:E3 ubiquitin-protein ligase RNF14 [Mytilus galloprovincialis]
MKELMMRYGYDLNTLVDECGLKYVELDRQRHILTVTGEQQAVQIAIEKIQIVIEETGLKMKGKVMQPSTTRECVVCFCEIEDGKMYRLEACGHSYCKECVQFQFQTDLNSLPVCCSSEGCEEKWVLKDITNIADITNNPVDRLVEKATSSFVAKNKKEYRYCTTPDCHIIYRVSEKENLFTCPQCESRICTGCHKQYHDGLSCEQVKLAETQEADDKNFMLFLQGCKLNIKKCPNCSTLIEKISGCNRVTCSACTTNICWVCLKHFPTAGDCYNHLSNEHGSVY